MERIGTRRVREGIEAIVDQWRGRQITEQSLVRQMLGYGFTSDEARQYVGLLKSTDDI